ncbi:uncharacterized protein LOC119999779 isoform X2 [Tripterygium wilfordii]|uniref:uncharacterized protein LOC119999779 isoform X2 n=1 Tax=Tripterygium wilfordii TaxID=458696 RepID=UPI0018F81BD0|nr:uncharacterized protein LOC119999779 isoform X2 [Tripterygium wilfordii]
MEDNSAAPTRPSIKTQSPFNNYPIWKDKLRENCYKRVRNDRSRLLWKMRLPTAQPLNHKDFMRSAFQDIVSDELEKIKDSSAPDNLKISETNPEVNDVLWEYGGLHDAYQGECEDILLEMQRIFYEDLKAGQSVTEPEISIETWEDEEDECLARAVLENMNLTDEQVDLEILRVRLAEAHEEHLDRGCRLKPKFCVETRFGLTALYICCQGCNIFEIII